MASNPEIPSFKNPQGQTPKEAAKPAEPQAKPQPEKSEEKKGGGVSPFSRPATAAKTPTFGTPTPAPALRIRGLSGGPKTLFERLKQFQKKDLIFIASGLGVLFMAPLAEHFMMSPSADKSLQPGFSSPGGSMFNGEVGPHEPGTGGMAPGGLVGSGSDVITPLNVRDPSALIMAPGASQVTPPPAATTVAPPPASASRESGGWKDALSAAKAGAEKGADAAKPGAFRAPGNIAGALRGLSALSGGSYGGGPTYSLSAPNASNVPNRGSTGGGLSQVTSAPGYKGVGARGLDSGGNAESLRRAAEGAGDRFNRGGGAAGNLEAAARETIPGGLGGGGASGAGAGGENKGGSGSTNKDNKALGESLAYLRMKMEMEKELDLKWSRKKWKEFEFPKMIYEEITKSAIQNILGKGMFEPMGKAMASMWAGAAGKASGIYCTIDGKTQNMPNADNAIFKCWGTGQAVSYAAKDGEPTGPPGAPFPCGSCTEYGDSAASSKTTEKPKEPKNPDGTPTAGDPTRTAQSSTAVGELAGSINTCDQQYKDTGVCKGVKLLPSIYDPTTGLPKVIEYEKTAEAKIKEAWVAMGEAVAHLRAAHAAMLEKVRPMYGNPRQANGQFSPGGDGVFEEATAALKHLDEVTKMTATTDGEAMTKLGEAKTAFEKAQKALERAKNKFTKRVGEGVDKVDMAKPAEGQPVNDDDKTAADRGEAYAASINKAQVALEAAKQDVLAGGKIISTSWQTLSKAEKLMLEPDTASGKVGNLVLLASMGKPLAQKADTAIQTEQKVLISMGGSDLALGKEAESGGRLAEADKTIKENIAPAATAVLNAFGTTKQVGLGSVKSAATYQVPALAITEGAKPMDSLAAVQKQATALGTNGLKPLVEQMKEPDLPAVSQALEADKEPLTKTACVKKSSCYPATGALPPPTRGEYPAPKWPADAPPPTAEKPQPPPHEH